ncbi:MAG: NAD(P)-dependent oxidoreductase, partial [Flavobacteriaceae bacterium]|nr:NAD(P)-dependent oxidoreductase [Flavobacteriaceae bacterium]
GYVGRQVCLELDKQGKEYEILTREPKHRNHIGIDLLNADSYELKNVFSRYEKILHCAWYVDRKDYRTSNQNEKWMDATVRIANSLERKNTSYFCAIGTCLEYRPSLTPKSVDSVIGPVCNYGVAKADTAKNLSSILARKKIAFAWARLFHIYGGDEHEKRLIPTIRQCIENDKIYEFSNSNHLIDLSHIEQVAQKIVKIIKNKKVGTFNICSGKSQSVKNIVLEFCNSEKEQILFKFNEKPMDNDLTGISNIFLNQLDKETQNLNSIKNVQD